MARTIVIHNDETPIQEPESCERQQMLLAYGHLATWNTGSFKSVHIYLKKDYELIAVYHKTVADADFYGDPDYVIGAIWDTKTKKYSFHS
jgi:hypothetical protein